MSVWILTVEALDASNNPVTLRYSDGAYIDGSSNYYEPRMKQAALVNVSPDDGGVLSIFQSGGIGDIELINVDGGLNYLIDYAVDGRAVLLSLVNDDLSITTLFTGTIDRMSERSGSLFFTMRSLTDALTKNHPASVYAGTNSPPNGLEGTTDTIEGRIKPKVFGDCLNVSPVMVNSSLLIYEASSRADAVITAVYDDGVRLTNYLVNNGAGYAAGATSIAVDAGVAGSSIPTNSKIIFDGHRKIYTVSAGISGATGTITITPALTTAIADNDHVEIINFYTGSGAGAGQLQNAITAAAWSSYNGYFRLAATPSKQITCDVMSVSAYVQHSAGDVFATIAGELGITVDSASVTALNAVGVIGINMPETTPSKDLFDSIARSVGGFYYYLGSTLYFSLFDAPSGSPVATIEEYQILSIERDATGLGSNGLPINEVKAQYNKIDTVQTTVAASTPLYRTELLKNEYRETSVNDAAVLTRHPLSPSLTIQTRLRKKADALAVINRLLGLCKVRRDVISVTAFFSQMPSIALGNTIVIKHSRYSYSAGRSFVIVGYEADMKRKKITLRLFG